MRASSRSPQKGYMSSIFMGKNFANLPRCGAARMIFAVKRQNGGRPYRAMRKKRARTPEMSYTVLTNARHSPEMDISAAGREFQSGRECHPS